MQTLHGSREVSSSISAFLSGLTENSLLRIDPQGTGVNNYDIRSDVWSLGISLIEMATGKFPYATWRSPFEQLKQVVTEKSPSLPPGEFSEPFEKLISVCLQKDVNQRPNYEQLLASDFIVEHTAKETNVAQFVEEILALKTWRRN